MKGALERLGNLSENVPPEGFRKGGKARLMTLRGTSSKSSLVHKLEPALEAAQSPTGTMAQPMRYRLSE
jgi:hypothetical protein